VPNPIHEGVDWAWADLVNLPAGATASAEYPTDSTLDHIHVQIGWDGTPSDADNREDASIRFTYWAPKGQPDEAIDAAEGGRARLMSSQATGRPNVLRVDRGTGRLPGVDPDTDLPFCTFNATVVLAALTP
jgi:hypothetical protein